MKIIAIANQKGGVGKTTTAVNLSVCLAQAGKRVLLIDLDPQANATSALGLTGMEGQSLYQALIGHATAIEKITPTRFEPLWIIPADIDLAGAEIEVARQEEHLTRLQAALSPMRQASPFDYIIMDTPPSLGVLMTNALAAADEVLVPLQCEYFALEGLSKIVNIVDQIAQCGANPSLKLSGIVMTMYDSRTNLSQQVVADVRQHFSEKVYQTMVPRSIRLGEAPSFGKAIVEYDPFGAGAYAYQSLAKEFLEKQR